jgi:Domain of unknown function (DUF4381)
MNPTVSPVLDLRDVHAPPFPGFWPPAPGWWIAAALLAGLLVFVSMQLYRRYRQRRLRRQVLATLDSLAAGYSSEAAVGFVTEVSMLLRRVALRRFPRRRVAALFGADWCRFLDETGGNGGFSRGAGQVLASGPYAARVDVDPEGLTTLARTWIRKNFGAAHGA